MLVRERRVKRTKGAGILDFFGNIVNIVGNFIRSPAVQAAKKAGTNFVKSDVGKTAVNVGKDIASTVASKIQDMIAERKANAQAQQVQAQQAQDLSQMADKIKEDVLASIQRDKMISSVPQQVVQQVSALATPEPFKELTSIAPIQTPTQVSKLQDTYGYGVNIKKINNLLREVCGRALSKFY